MPTVTDFGGESPTPPTKCSRCWKFVRQVLSFLLSHIGLLSLVVGYCIMGAFIFEELERYNEIAVKRNMTKNRLGVTEDLWEITKSMEVLRQEDWTQEVTNRLRSFEKSLIIALKEKGWDGKESEETVTWTFAGGLFYSITVITTIGYGHIAPKTPIAKVVTIFYAILGIPLTVLCWSNIGDAMANAFRFCYWRVCCYICTKKPKKKKKKPLSRSSRAPSVRYAPSSRSRSVRRSIKTHRSADTISDSLISYSISDQERFYDDGSGYPPSQQQQQPQESFQRNRPSKRSLPRSLQIQSQQYQPDTTDPAVAATGEISANIVNNQHQQPTAAASLLATTSVVNAGINSNQLSPPMTGGAAANSSSATGKVEEKVETKKPSFTTVARVARGLGLKRHETKAVTNVTTVVTTATSNGNNDKSNAAGLQPTALAPRSHSTSGVVPTAPFVQQGKPSLPNIPVMNQGGKLSMPATMQPSLTPTNSLPPPPNSGLPPGVVNPHQQLPPYRLDRVPEDEWTIIDDYYDDYVSEDEMEDYSTKPVPIWLSICLVIGYIVGGAFLFQEWEGWSMLDSSYFCFITLTTIGFGDLVPDQKNTDGEIRIALCSLYLLFGIAMICMSFNLVQEEVINNVKGIAMQLGIIKDDDEDDE